MRMVLTKEDIKLLAESYFKERSLVEFHIRSYNWLIDRGLQEVVDEVHEIEIDKRNKVVFGKIEVGKPEIIEPEGGRPYEGVPPSECRLRDLTYAAPLYLYMHIYIDGIEEKVEKHRIGIIPIMVKSSKCVLSGKGQDELIKLGEDPFDPGGYFIIHGGERVIVPREELAVNQFVVEREKEGRVIARGKIYSRKAGIRSYFALELNKDGTVTASIPRTTAKIPAIALIKALGLVRDRDIIDAISSEENVRTEIYPAIEEVSSLTSREAALDYIGRRVFTGLPKQDRIQRTESMLQREFLPHVGTTPQDGLKKAYLLAKMIEKLVKVGLGIVPPDDLDHYANKRVRLAGDLLQELFRRSFTRMARRMEAHIRERLASGAADLKEVKLKTCIQTDYIEQGFLTPMATGNWGRGETGVSQLLDRTNIISTLSHMRRVVSPLTTAYAHFEARELHPSSYGRLCSVETPEGVNCGLVKNLAIFAEITSDEDPSRVIQECYRLGVKPIEQVEPREFGSKTVVMVNGAPIGVTDDPEYLVRELRENRAVISLQMNVSYRKDEKVVSINVDGGRVRRPLIPVKKLHELERKIHLLRKGAITFSKLVKEGIIEFIDAEEEEDLLVATTFDQLTPEHTHLDLAPFSQFGLCANMIPYAEHNNATRNVMGANMTRQALGLHAANWIMRSDSRFHILYYPQRPIVETVGARIIGYPRRPAGQNLVVALIAFEGYNMEDAVILNRGAVDRGMGRSTFFRIYSDVEKRYRGGLEDRFEIPDPKSTRGTRISEAYSSLGDDGIAEVEQRVSGGDILIGKTSPPRFIGEYLEYRRRPVLERRDTSVEVRHGESGIVTLATLYENENGYRAARVVVRDIRIPELGDKFATRHGQKGVVGMIYPQEDMPFTEDGITPDIILNPHAIASRMTIGQLIELLAGKVGALEGSIVDGTPFMGRPVDDLKKALLELGFEPGGTEVMYDGRTGEIIETEIFIGVGFYQKLHHMVRDKIHARARGPVDVLTRQPPEGRSREGGLRVGEMEKEAIVGHGGAMLAYDRLIECSDKTVIYVCRKCGLLGYYDKFRDDFVCILCGDKGDVVPVSTGYAFFLFLRELISAGIRPRLKLKEASEVV
ncbi:MAG: DNA-directed RNA polymerase subunit B [Thermoproteota archaeon]|nr:MAG: DNA-directed RNA polymerase subunit B [Candidatus Korarchaeota archaeon]